MKISAVILTKNEENNIERCLKSLDFCDEVIVVDDYSEDKTIEKIRNPKSFDGVYPEQRRGTQDKSEIRNKSKILIFKRKLNGDFAEQKNFGMERARNEWILFVDADEEVSVELKNEIISIQHNFQFPTSNFQKEAVAFRIKRRDYWWGRELKYGEIRKIRQCGLIRLVKRESGKWQGKVHEKFEIRNPSTTSTSLSINPLRTSSQFEIRGLKNFLNHYPHPIVKEFLHEINFYSTLRAKELFEKGKKTNILEIILYPLGKFFLNYVLYIGFLDHFPGFVYAFLMSFHSFLVRAKLYQYTRISTNEKA